MSCHAAFHDIHKVTDMNILGHWESIVLEVSSPKHAAQNATNLHPHTQDQTQYRRPIMKEHDHHWDSQQDLN
jgi:hypothetical protein